MVEFDFRLRLNHIPVVFFFFFVFDKYKAVHVYDSALEMSEVPCQPQTAEGLHLSFFNFFHISD